VEKLRAQCPSKGPPCSQVVKSSEYRKKKSGRRRRGQKKEQYLLGREPFPACWRRKVSKESDPEGRSLSQKHACDCRKRGLLKRKRIRCKKTHPKLRPSKAFRKEMRVKQRRRVLTSYGRSQVTGSNVGGISSCGGTVTCAKSKEGSVRTKTRASDPQKRGRSKIREENRFFSEPGPELRKHRKTKSNLKGLQLRPSPIERRNGKKQRKKG